jgi:autotransporter-associated beta strand protein
MRQTTQRRPAAYSMTNMKPTHPPVNIASMVRTSASKVLFLGILSLAMMVGRQDVLADTFFSKGATGDPTALTSWTNAANANPANFTSGDTFIILNGCTLTANQNWVVNATTAGTAATVQINSSGILALDNGTTSYSLNLGGNLVQNNTSGGITTSTSRGSSIIFTSSGSWTGSGDMSYSTAKINVTINSGVVLTASSVTTGFKLKTGNTITWTCNGTLDMGTRTFNGNASANNATFVLGANGTLICANTGGLGAITGGTATGTFFNFTSTSKVTLPTTANYIFNGSSAQVTSTSLPATVNGLTLNNSAGITLSQATEVDGVLTLTAGKVTGNVTLGSSGTISGGGSTAYINGQLTVPFSAPSGVSYTFPVGTASTYSPIALANLTDASGGTLTASATASQNPNQGSSGIDGSLYIARYWTLTGSGFSSPTYDFTGTYVAGDIQNGANPNSLIVRKWDGSSWASPASSSSVAYTVTGTGFNTSFGQFAAGQAQTTIPVLDSTTKSAITNAGATLGATLENNFSQPITDYGIVWSTSPGPTTANNKVQVGTTTPTLGSPFTGNATGLPAGTIVYYRGYATSSSGTGYTTNDSFLTLTNEPTTQASGVSGVSRQNGDLLISWVRGNGSKCIVLVKAGSAVDSNPVDGTTYTANATFGSGAQIGSGNYVAYLGTGTNVTITGLSANTTYYVAVYELNGSGGSENYLAPPATGNKTTVANPVTSLTWTGTQDINWNNTNNWDALQVPDVGTAVLIPNGPANQPTYSNQMAVASFGSLTNAGILNINTNGFNSGVMLLVRSTDRTTIGAQLNVNNGGAMNVAGNLALCSNSVVIVNSGGSLTASGQLIVGSGPTGSGSGTVGSYGAVTNNGGNLNVGSTAINGTGFALTSSSKNCLLVINGGTNNLGNVTIKRNNTGSFGALGSDGLAIYNGIVTMNGVDVGNGSASHLSMLIAGGVVTNNGSVLINQGTSARGSRLNQTGGLFVVTNLVNPNPTVSGSLNIYSVTGGTNIIGGAAFGTGSSVGNVLFTNSAVMYVGSLGMTWDGSVTLNATLSGGSLLGATADWTGTAPLLLDVGTVTIQAADMSGVAHNIALSGVLSGSGALTKTGAGTLTLNAAETYNGNTLVGAGTLALGASGSLNNSGQILVNGGTTFDVSAASGYTVPTGKTLGGEGTVAGNVTFAAGANLSPGDSTTKSNLTFTGNLVLNGAATVFDFNPNPSSPNNDMVTVAGQLNISAGGNTVDVTGTGPAGSIYPLFKYGTLNGNLANLSLTPAAAAIGYLSNNTVAVPNMIAYVVTNTVHTPTNVVWVGNNVNNVWDALTTTNWMLNGSLVYFINNDTAIFNNVGQARSNVLINVTVLPTTTTVDSSGDYVFSGAGSIGGNGGITKTNTGRLYIQNTNTFTGGVSIKKGTVSVASLQPDNTPSPLGQTGTLLADGGALEYTGPATSWTRPLTVGTNVGTISLPSGSDLTYSGTISGSGSLAKSDNGTLTLGTANTYTGGTYLNGGALTLGVANGAGSGSIAFNGNSILNIGSLNPANTIVVSNYNGVVRGSTAGSSVGSIKNVAGNSNLVIAVTAGTFDLAGDMTAYSGTLTCSNAGGAFIRLNGSTGSKLATWDTGSGTMDLSVRNKSTTPYYFGALTGGSSSTLTGPTGGDSAGHGAATYQIGDNGLSTTFDGTIKNGSDASQVLSIVKTGTGTLTLSGSSSYTGTTVVSNGTLQVNGSLTGSGAVTIAGGTLAGSGSISGAATFNSGSTLKAGAAGVGPLTFNSNLTLDGGSTNIFFVTSAGGASNTVYVGGQLTPNGSLLKIVSGTPLAVGTYPLFTHYGGVSGSFNATPVFDVAPADTASIVDTGSQINLVIGTPAGPHFNSITTSGSDIILNATGGTPYGSVTVLSSTDLTVPVASWTVETTGNFDGSGNYSYTATGALTSGNPQKFYILQISQ